MRDSYADIAALADVDVASKPDAYSEAMRHAYRQDKDLSGALAIAWAGIGRLLALAHVSEPARAHDLRSRTKALTYDLASFTWAGWDEAGIVITPPEARAGWAAARANLALALELDKGALAQARAHWMLGAHELAAGRPGEARASFEDAARLGDAAGSEGAAEAALARAFVTLSEVASGAADESGVAAAVERLRATPGGSELAGQVNTAKEALDIGS